MLPPGDSDNSKTVADIETGILVLGREGRNVSWLCLGTASQILPDSRWRIEGQTDRQTDRQTPERHNNDKYRF